MPTSAATGAAPVPSTTDAFRITRSSVSTPPLYHLSRNGSLTVKPDGHGSPPVPVVLESPPCRPHNRNGVHGLRLARTARRGGSRTCLIGVSIFCARRARRDHACVRVDDGDARPLEPGHLRALLLHERGGGRVLEPHLPHGHPPVARRGVPLDASSSPGSSATSAGAGVAHRRACARRSCWPSSRSSRTPSSRR
jgi:hypothetical protein